MGTTKAVVLSLAQSKGGTGKTSSALNIASSLCKKGYKVLAVDTDAQASLTASLGVDPSQLAHSMRSLLTDPNITAQDVIVATNETNLDLIPSNVDLSMVEFHMPAVGRERVLNRKLRPILSSYDWVVIDTPPNFSITTLNAMAASEYLLVPIQPEPLCLLGMSQLHEAYNLVRQESNPNLEILGVFITMYDSRIGYHKEVAEQVRADWGDLTFNSMVYRRSNILHAALEGKSSVSLAPNSDLAQSYMALTAEVIERVHR